MAESKLRNIKALNEMLAGTHRTQNRKTYGFSDTEAANEKNKVREIGEVWETKDINGNIIWWTQNKGFKSRSNVSPELQKMYQDIREYQNKFPNCRKETCTCIQPNRLDIKFKRIMGMCEECLISMETSLKMQGKFDQYAIDKMKANADAFFKQADQEVEIIKKEIFNINFAGDENETNPIEKWSFQDPESFVNKIDEDYATFKKNTLERLESNRS